MDSNKLTVFFVPGMGVRGSTDHEVSIREHLKKELKWPYQVKASDWGKQVGVRIEDVKKVIPPKRNSMSLSLTDEEISRNSLWRGALNNDDPVFELRWFLASKQNNTNSHYEEQEQREQERREKKVFTNRLHEGKLGDKLLLQLKEAGIHGQVFDEARAKVVASDEYKAFLDEIPRTGSIGSYLEAIARAVVVQAVMLEASYDLPILSSGDLRDHVIDEFREWLGPGELGRADLLPSGIMVALQYMLLDGTSPFLHPSFYDAHYKPGDIVYYLARGQDIRAYVHSEIQALSGSVVLLAHSLGGVIAVDLLFEEILHHKGELLKKVRLLITAGSQVPYLYALNSLCSLSRDQYLPTSTRFPRWINLYDPLDPLSFRGSEIFGENGIVVEDKQLQSKKLFPESHSNYWKNEKTYKYIVKALSEEHLIDER